MLETSESPLGDNEELPRWKKLLIIQKDIDERVKAIDPSGPDFWARNELTEQLRKKYRWYEEWVLFDFGRDIIKWAEVYQKYQKDTSDSRYSPHLGVYINLAEKNYLEAKERFRVVDETLERMKNKLIAEVISNLEKIRGEIKTKPINLVVIDFLEYLYNLKKEVAYSGLPHSKKVSLENHFQFFKKIPKGEEHEKNLKIELVVTLNKIIDLFKSQLN